MSFRFAVIGGGWYGAHIASSFRALGFEVTLFDRASKLLSAASGNNQFRLHLGFHYARNYRTRMQSRDGYSRFMERYSSLSAPVENNIYAVPNSESLIDFLTYRLIMTSSGIEYSEVRPSDFGITNCDGAILTSERVLLTERARGFFSRRLEGCLRLGEEVLSIEEADKTIRVNGEPFDYAVDATWGHLTPIGKLVFFEPTLLLYYKTKTPHFALTMVDGDLCSLYPTEMQNIFTLSSVRHTPLGQFESNLDAIKTLENFSQNQLKAKIGATEEQIKKYLPHFTDVFEYVSPQFSIKTKLMGASDDRSCYVSKQSRKFVVMSGKIDTIFFAAERILALIEGEQESDIGNAE